MPSSHFTYDLPHAPTPVLCEEHIEQSFIGKLQGLKYDYRPDITDRSSREKNLPQKFSLVA